MNEEPASAALTPPFDTKIAIVVREGLAPWQQLNVTAFLTSGISAANPQLIGEPYADADGTAYLALLGIPILVFEASGDTLVAARQRGWLRGGGRAA
ncbi:MAG TPA: DUF2000 domain-containing protein, partial [Phycicoccus sp.]|nr:DUF2000 domain-containing protein [Phycicoccus sp.]